MAAWGSIRQLWAKLVHRNLSSCLQIFQRTPQSLKRLLISRGFILSQVSVFKVPDSEWKKKLTSEQFWVCRLRGTEPPWSGEYIEFNGKGTYQCICCGADLFSSDSKFDSGTGWPSFSDVIQDHSNGGQSSDPSVSQKHDSSHGMIRIEVLCRKCNSHLGHVFQDGPPPTGLRYCINSIALKFKPATQ